jgi:hypothetical protein
MKLILAATTLLGGLAVPAWIDNAAVIDGISDGDAKAIQVAVRSQIEALSVNDAVGAFQLATLDRQSRIGSPDKFLSLIKKHYQPLHQHLLVLYSRPAVVKGETFQAVRVTDKSSHVWLAVFQMQAEQGGRWKIDACYLLETKKVSV